MNVNEKLRKGKERKEHGKISEYSQQILDYYIDIPPFFITTEKVECTRIKKIDTNSNIG